MSSFTAKSSQERKLGSSSRERTPRRGGLAGDGSVRVPLSFADNRAIAVAQRQLQQGVDDSPRQMAQHRGLAAAFGLPVQREERLVAGAAQGALEPVQREADLDEEEMLQGKFAPVQREELEDEELLQGRFDTHEPAAQRESAGGAGDNRTGMPSPLKSGLEQLSGKDLSDVRVHYNSSKPASLNALAYAQGNDIHLAPGQEKHLPHEGWHTVQQMEGRVKPTMQAEGVAINDDSALEHEADVMGAKALRM